MAQQDKLPILWNSCQQKGSFEKMPFPYFSRKELHIIIFFLIVVFLYDMMYKTFIAHKFV